MKRAGRQTDRQEGNTFYMNLLGIIPAFIFVLMKAVYGTSGTVVVYQRRLLAIQGNHDYNNPHLLFSHMNPTPQTCNFLRRFCLKLNS